STAHAQVRHGANTRAHSVRAPRRPARAVQLVLPRAVLPSGLSHTFRWSWSPAHARPTCRSRLQQRGVRPMPRSTRLRGRSMAHRRRRRTTTRRTPVGDRWAVPAQSGTRVGQVAAENRGARRSVSATKILWGQITIVVLIVLAKDGGGGIQWGFGRK